MKIFLAVLGVLLVVGGLLAIFHPRFDYRRQEEVARVGGVRATFDRHERTVVPPVAAALALAAGAVLIVLASRSK